MQRLTRIDVAERFEPGGLRLAAQAAFGLACALLMILVRSGLDLFAPTSGPFALVYPTVLLATLFGRWQAGVFAYVTSFVWAWYFVLSYERSFAFELDTDPMRVVINALACLIVLLFAELFRSAVRSNEAALEASLDRRLVLLAELEHRTKNNFALVASLLDIQRRRQSIPEAASALEDAAGRVRTFSDAYSNLALEQAEGSEVSMKPYLEQLLDRIVPASFGDEVTVEHDLQDFDLPRDQGVGIGLYLNEALSNCAKYAFPDERAGRLVVSFSGTPRNWTLRVQDDGMGRQAVPAPGGGLGQSLMEAFARQARATHEVDVGDRGCLATLRGSDR